MDKPDSILEIINEYVYGMARFDIKVPEIAIPYGAFIRLLAELRKKNPGHERWIGGTLVIINGPSGQTTVTYHLKN